MYSVPLIPYSFFVGHFPLSFEITTVVGTPERWLGCEINWPHKFPPSHQGCSHGPCKMMVEKVQYFPFGINHLTRCHASFRWYLPSNWRVWEEDSQRIFATMFFPYSPAELPTLRQTWLVLVEFLENIQ